MNKELENKFNLYDKIITSCMVNTYSLAKNKKEIILRNFDETNPYHLFEYEISKIIKSLRSEIDIYIDMKLSKYLLFKFKHRKAKIQLKKYKKSQNYNNFDIMAMLNYVTNSYGVNLEFIKEIYNDYWNRREIK